MELTCKKCQFVNTDASATKDDPCPRCGAIYAKVDAFLGLKAKHDAAVARAKPATTPSDPKPPPQKSKPAQAKPAPQPQPPQPQQPPLAKQQSQLINCPACGAAMSKQAKACPNCGQPAKKKTSKFTWTVIAAVVLVGLINSMNDIKDFPSSDSERNFLNIVDAAITQWGNVTRGLRRSETQAAIVEQRNKALCNVPESVSNWTGKVKSVGSLSENSPAYLYVALNDHVTLRPEGDLEGALEHKGSHVPKGTPLYDAISRLEPGQRVVFSGKFIRGEKTCLYETSLTNDGSITDPAFEFIFTDVKGQ